MLPAVDGPIGQYFAFVAELSTFVLIKVMAVVLVSPWFIIPGMAVAIFGGWCGQIYIKGQLSVKREMSNARAPVLSHFGAAMNGLSTFILFGPSDVSNECT